MPPLTRISPGVLAYLYKIETEGPQVRPRSNVPATARRRGWVDDEVRILATGEVTTAGQARQELGDDWFQYTVHTTRDVLTAAGRYELQRRRNKF